MPEISIITPVYNAGPYLENTIASVSSQGFSSFEWLICDDGSTDGSFRILSRAASRDPRIRLFSQENSGVSAARNACLSQLRGQYLMFLDADDSLEPDALEKLHEAITVSEADLCIYGWYIHRGDELFSYIFEERELDASDEERYRMILQDPYLCGGGYPWNKLWRVDATEKLPAFDPRLHHYEDKLWTLEMLDALGSPNVCFVNEPLYHYFLRDSSLSHSMTPEAYTALAGYTLDSLEAIRAYIEKAHPKALKTCDELIQQQLKEIKETLGPYRG